VAVVATACAILGLWTQSAHIGAPPLGVARSNRHVWFRVDVSGSRLQYSVDHIRHLPELIVMADANVVAIPSTQSLSSRVDGPRDTRAAWSRM
jgi:hypothetical protein